MSRKNDLDTNPATDHSPKPAASQALSREPG